VGNATRTNNSNMAKTESRAEIRYIVAFLREQI